MLAVTDETFSTEVLEASKNNVVIVDFWADWCGPCKILTPLLEKLSQELDDVKFVSANVDDCGLKAGEYLVMSVPTLLFVKEGNVKDRIAGANPAMTEQIQRILESLKG